MKSLTLYVFSLLSIFSLSSSFKGCENTKIKELCKTNVVDHCYTCVRINAEPSESYEPECVPVFHNNLSVINNYPQDAWNCTMYRPTSENESNELIDACNIVEFLEDICQEDDKNEICMIANYIHDMCGENEESRMESNNYQVADYVSPWGSKSECITKDYKEICSDKVTKSCFDCRTPTLKIGPVISYYHLCFPLFASDNENNLVTRLKNDKWECKKFINPNYKSKN